MCKLHPSCCSCMRLYQLLQQLRLYQLLQQLRLSQLLQQLHLSHLLQLHAPVPVTAAAAPVPAVAAAAPVPAVAAAAPILNHGPWRGTFLVIEFYSVILGIYTGPSLGYLWWCPFREYLQRWWARLTHILGPLRMFNLPND